jgi:hypothetical protein
MPLKKKKAERGERIDIKKKKRNERRKKKNDSNIELAFELDSRMVQ